MIPTAMEPPRAAEGGQQEPARTGDEERLEMSSMLGQLLLEQDYSIEQLIERARKWNLNLRELRDQLIKHQQELQQTSLELFNNSYDRFFKLSHLIACLAEPVKHVIQPIQNYRNQLGQLCRRHDNYLQDIDNRLAALEDASRNKLVAKRLMALIRRRDRIFEQVQRIEWLKHPSVDMIFEQLNTTTTTTTTTTSAANDSITFQVNCDSIERVFIELHYLLCEVNALQPTSDELIPIKKTLESTVCEQQRRLGLWFADMLQHAIQVQDGTFIKFILGTYEQCGDFKELEAVWRQQVVRPYLSLIVVEGAGQQELQQTCNLLRQFLDKHLDLLQHRPFVARSFWSEVVESLERLKQIYTSDDVRTFKERYEIMRAFLSNQPNGSEAAENVARILAKFDLLGYFNQKSTEIRTSIEASFMQQPLSELPAATDTLQQPKFRLKICSQIYQLVTKCWSAEIYIDALDGNFVQLVCRLLEKFADWLSRLSLSDFRIVGGPMASGAGPDRTTNFLARQDAIMRLLIEDCTNLMHHIEQYELSMPQAKGPALDGDEQSTPVAPRRAALLQSLEVVKNGLDNVRNLQKLLER